MKAKEIRQLSVEDMRAKAVDLSEELNKLRFQHGIRPLENTTKLRHIKRDIARYKTLITEKIQAE